MKSSIKGSTWLYATVLSFPCTLATVLSSPADLSTREYDFIVLGGGTGGSVVASRLSENANVTVLVVEDGGNNEGQLALEVPFMGVTLPGTAFDWNYTTTPQDGLNNRTFHYTRGHVLGGSSSINLLTWNRASDDLWNRWASLTEDDGWSWKQVEQYYLKTSQLVAPSDGRDTTGQVDPSVHGNGPVEVSVSGFLTDIDPIVEAASKELGGRFKFNVDYNSGDFVGTSYMQSSIGGGERSSAATAYLPTDVRDRTNLDILLNTRALRLVQTDNSTAGPVFKGVQIAQSADDTPITITAKNEIIVSGGAFGTPQLLLLSGIGPEDDLKELSITPLVNSPDVGNHLLDHTLLPNYFNVSINGTWDDVVRDSAVFNEKLQQWLDTRQGLFTDSPGNSLSYLRLPDNSSAFAGIPDPASGPLSPHTELIFVDGFAAFGPIAQPATGNFITVLSAVSSTTSTGSLKLASSNPFDIPLIDPRLLTTTFDIEAMVQAMKDTQEFFAADAWQADVKPVPFGDLATATTDELLAEYARNNAFTESHPSGTARMSPDNASWGVVDSKLKVKGAQGIRVVDASVFPVIPECHIQAPIYIIAERASDLIKADYGL